MPVIDQIAEASDKFFDTVEENNERAKTATIKFVHRMRENELPFADRIPTEKLSERMPALPFVDRIPPADKAVSSSFDMVSAGIEANRNFVGRMMERLGAQATAAPVVVSKPAPTVKSAPKKTTAKKTTAKKTTAKKTTAKKAPAKKATAKK